MGKLDDTWLAELGGSWWAPPPQDVDGAAHVHLGDLNRLRQSADLFTREPDWYVKDPRISLLIPLWDQLCLQRLPLVLAIRDPREVAQSLALRDGFSHTAALALWLAYNHAVLTSSGGRSVLVIDYASALADPDRTVTALAEFLRGNTTVQPSQAAVTGAAALFEPELRRNRRAELDRPGEAALEDAEAWYTELRACHTAPDADLNQLARPIPEWARTVLRELSARWRAELERQRLEQSAAQAAAERDEQARLVAQAAAERDELVVANSRLSDTLGLAQAQQDELERSLLMTTQEREALTKELQAATQDMQTLRARHQLALAESSTLQSELGQSTALFLQAREQLDRINASRSYQWSQMLVRRLRFRSVSDDSRGRLSRHAESPPAQKP